MMRMRTRMQKMNKDNDKIPIQAHRHKNCKNERKKRNRKFRQLIAMSRVQVTCICCAGAMFSLATRLFNLGLPPLRRCSRRCQSRKHPLHL